MPARIFSEAMRDVDLFVAVCSVGADEGWADQGAPDVRAYWHEFAFGELSELGRTRHEALGRILPRLAIADRCRLEPRWLNVQGTRHAYRIHLGSGNIQVMPEQRYLCIVPKPGKEGGRVFLPFEGDRTLAVILSKAILLADDAKITDKSILAQL